MGVVVKFVTAEEVRPLRTQILRPASPPDSLLVFPEDELPECAHVAAISDRKIIGVATFLLKPTRELDDPQAIQLRGMAVDAQMQGSGIGKCILEFAFKELKNRFSNSKWVWCNARDSATHFYDHCGFEIISDVFDIPEIGPHFRMAREIYF